MTNVYFGLLIYGVVATSVGFYFKGVERGRQLSEDEGGAHS